MNVLKVLARVMPLAGVAALVLLAQNKPAAPPPVVFPTAGVLLVPQLKPEVALELRNAQWEQAKVVIQIVQDNAKVNDGAHAQAELPGLAAANQRLSASLLALESAALKKSGIDADKFELDPDTLTVRPKQSGQTPTPAAEAAKP